MTEGRGLTQTPRKNISYLVLSGNSLLTPDEERQGLGLEHLQTSRHANVP